MGNSMPGTNHAVAEESRLWTPSRRTVVKGAAWAAPVVALGAPVAHAGISQCTVTGSLQIGPKKIVPVDAVCTSNSQNGGLNTPRIYTGYGKAYLPDHITICSCDNIQGWYRFRETDSLSSFQIEVDGRHNDQNSSTAGYRPAFYLNGWGEEGGCRTFTLKYRTSASRPYSDSTSATGPSNNAYHNVSIDIVLQRSSQNVNNPNTAPGGGWSAVPGGTFQVTGGKVWRTVTSRLGDPVNFRSCTSQGSAAARSEAVEQSSGSGD